MKAVRPISASYLAYVFLLMAFVSLHVFVAALATGSVLAVFAGAGLVACLAGAVAGFRVAARELTQSKTTSDTGSQVSIFSTPLRPDQIDQYLDTYRGGSL